MRKNGANRRNRDEQGATLILLLQIIMASAFIAVLAIDIPKHQRIARQMQRAVDSAALAGAQVFLNGTNDEAAWRNAKRAALAFLEVNRVSEDKGVLLDLKNSKLVPKDTTYADPADSGNYRYTTFEIRDEQSEPVFELVLERVAYVNPDGGLEQIDVMELGGGSNCRIENSGDPICDCTRTFAPGVDCACGGLCEDWIGPGNGPSVYDAANAMRVTLRHLKSGAIFANLFGNAEEWKMKRTALAAPDS
jgi:hypothetical protein